MLPKTAHTTNSKVEQQVIVCHFPRCEGRPANRPHITLGCVKMATAPCARSLCKLKECATLLHGHTFANVVDHPLNTLPTNLTLRLLLVDVPINCHVPI